MDDKSQDLQLAEEIEAKLDEEGMQRLAECKTDEEALAVLSEAGVELTDEMLDQVAGGSLIGLVVRLPKEKRFRPRGPMRFDKVNS